MNNSPYLRVGPVAIHLHSRETSYKRTFSSSEFSVAGPTLGVQGSIFLSPEDGTIIQELNGALPSETLGAPPPASSPPSPPPPPMSSSVASIPSSPTPSVYPSASSPAPAPPSTSSIQQPNVQKSSTPGSQASSTLSPLPTSPQETKGYSSNPVPALSLSSGASSQPTVLAGSTTIVPSDSGLIGLSGPTSTNSLDTATPTVALNNSTTNKNITSIIAGSILAAILGIVLIVAVITWFLRVRSRRRSEGELSWDPEPNPGHGDSIDSFLNSPSQFQPSQDRTVPPGQQRIPGPTIMLHPDFPEPQTMQSSYPHLATPELARTTGPLTVTNLMPGDVPLSTNTSIFMSSRPGSAQVTPRIDNSAPRFTRLHDGGLPVPWSHGVLESYNGPPSRPRIWPSRFSATSLKNLFSPSAPKPIRTESPQPRTSAANMRNYFKLSSNSNVQLPEPGRTADHTWSGTIRTGITNAWSAMTGTSARPHEPPESNLTPIRPRPNRRLSSKTGLLTLGSMSTTSTQSTAGYTMEERSQFGLPVTYDYSYGRFQRTPSDETIIEEQVEEGSETDDSTLPGSSALEKSPEHGVVTERITIPVSQIPRAPDDVIGRPSSVPRLPTIRPLSRAWTLRSEGFVTLPESDDGYRSAFNQMINERRQEYDRRLAELEAVATKEASRPVMSRTSTTSLMTESTALSRESSVVDDDERRAKKVLRMRRKRAMALSASSSIGNGKISGSARKRT